MPSTVVVTASHSRVHPRAVAAAVVERLQDAVAIDDAARHLGERREEHQDRPIAAGVEALLEVAACSVRRKIASAETLIGRLGRAWSWPSSLRCSTCPARSVRC